MNKSSALPLLIIAAIFAAILKFGSLARIDPVACGSVVTPDRDTVVMLGASWCRYCNRARALFVENNIAYCEYDIEYSDIGAKMYRRAGFNVIPIMYVRDAVIVGFDADEIMQTLIAENLAPSPTGS